jgi:hypothetical protein
MLPRIFMVFHLEPQVAAAPPFDPLEESQLFVARDATIEIQSGSAPCRDADPAARRSLKAAEAAVKPGLV